MRSNNKKHWVYWFSMAVPYKNISPMVLDDKKQEDGKRERITTATNPSLFSFHFLSVSSQPPPPNPHSDPFPSAHPSKHPTPWNNSTLVCRFAVNSIGARR